MSFADLLKRRTLTPLTPVDPAGVNEKGAANQQLDPVDPVDPEKPASPSANDAHASAADPTPADALLADEDAREHFEERAAIAEFDGELSRGEAEQLASSRVYEYRLAGINQWLTLIGSDDGGLETAKRWCAERYGDRVEAVRRYRPSSLSGRADK